MCFLLLLFNSSRTGKSGIYWANCFIGTWRASRGTKICSRFVLFVLMWVDSLKWNTSNCYEDSFAHEFNSKLTIENFFSNILKCCKSFKAKKMHEIFVIDIVYTSKDDSYTSHTRMQILKSSALNE